jgi:hypothetical protein
MDHLLSRHDVLIIGRGMGRRKEVRTYTIELIAECDPAGGAVEGTGRFCGRSVMIPTRMVVEGTAVLWKLRICKM